jgi:hypothetical protein
MSLDNQLSVTSNQADLAALIMSEASVGNEAERTAVGFTVINRMRRNRRDSVCEVWRAYAHGQQPTAAIVELAGRILKDSSADPTDGCTHYYSPLSMPKEGDDVQGYDVAGGLEQTPGLPRRNYRPGWALRFTYEPVPGVRPSYFKFFRVPGDGPVG